MCTCTGMAITYKVNRSWSGQVLSFSSLENAALDFSLGLNCSLQNFAAQMTEHYQTAFEFIK